MQIIDVIGKYQQKGRIWFDRTTPIKKITVHHTASRYAGSDNAVLTALMNDHIKNDWPGLSYHFVILEDGSIYQINSLDKVTWHDGVNWDSIGIVVHGYFHPTYNANPTKKQLESLDWLLDNLCNEHPEFPADQDDVLGHRERMATACPGNNLFPKIVDYRTSLGNTDWGLNEEPKTPEIPVNTGALDINKDIPSEIEEQFGLKEKAWYDKYWTLGEFIKYCVNLGQGEIAYRAFLQYMNAKLTGASPVTPKELKEEESDLQFNVDKALHKIATNKVKNIDLFTDKEISDEYYKRLTTNVLAKIGVKPISQK